MTQFPRGLAWLLPLLALLCWGCSTQYFTGLSNDDSLYLSAARSLATGKGFTDMHLADHPPHQKYPIGYPLLLSLVERVCPQSLTAPRVFSVLLSLGCVALIWALRRDRVGLLLAVLTGANVMWAQYSSTVGAEPAYTLVLLLFVLAFEHATHPALLGLFEALALYLRTAGLALLAAGALASLSLRERPTRVLGPILIALLLLLPYYFSQDRLLGYKEEHLIQDPWVNVRFYAALPLMLWGNPWALRFWMTTGPAAYPLRLLDLVGWGLLGLGGWVQLRQGSRAGRLAATLVVSVLGLHLVYHFLDFRYFLPVLPALYALALSGAQRLGGRRAVLAFSLTALLGNLTFVAVDAAQKPVQASLGCYAWVVAHTGPDDVLGSEYEDAWLYTGRPMVHVFPEDLRTGEGWLYNLYLHHVRWLTLTRLTPEHAALLAFLRQRPERFTQVYDNPTEGSMVFQLGGDGERYIQAWDAYRQGAVEFDRGRWEAALADFQQALALEGDRDLGAARYACAVTLWKSGHPDEAREQVQKLLAAQPDHPQGKALLQQLERR